MKKQRKNPNAPARFVNKIAAAEEGEKAKIHYYLAPDKIAEEEMYDGLYAVCTDLLDDDVADILKVSEDKTLLYFKYTALSATVPVFMRDCGTYLTLKVSKTRI